MKQIKSPWFTTEQRLAAIGAFALSVIVLIVYHPSIRVGFLGDDWWFLGKAAALNLPDYIAFYFDPAQQIFWYRPLYGILLLIEYAFFAASPEGYHVVQILLHLTNCLLLFALVGKLSGRWRAGLVAALFYAVLPVYSSAVFWIAVQDPLAMVFFLTAVLLWIIYLRTRRNWFYWLAFGAFVLALLGKETNFFLLVVLFLLDWWFISGKFQAATFLKRYSLFAVVLTIYLMLENQVQTNAYFPNRWGYSMGWHVLQNGVRYLALLASPWELSSPENYFWLALVLGVLLVLGLRLRSKLLLFLGVTVLLAIAPAVAFPTTFFYPRYLYAAAMVSGILIALFCEIILAHWATQKIARVIFSLAVGGFVLFNTTVTLGAAEFQVEEGRQFRVPLRDIYQQHLTFTPDTYLYFVEPPYPMIMRNLGGMFALRYGSNVTVWSNDVEYGGVDANHFARLREHTNAFVYYFDAQKQHREIAVDPSDRSTASPALPANFEQSIRFEGYEVTGTTLKRGSDLGLLLYWKAFGQIEKDYTVFVHLVSEKGKQVLGEDNQPRGGREPTHSWDTGTLVVDAHILAIPPEVPRGEYRLELGLYYLPTMERLWLVDRAGNPVADHILIEPFEIVE